MTPEERDFRAKWKEYLNQGCDHVHPSTEEPHEVCIEWAFIAIAAAVQAEREACERLGMTAPAAPYDRTEKLYRAGWEDAVTMLVAAIRARSGQEEG